MLEPRRGHRAIARRSLGSAASCLLLLGCAGSLAPGSSSPGASHALMGAAAPTFELVDVATGAAASPAAYAGKVVLVDFWATWCAPCKQSFPAYQRLVEALDGQLVVLAVSQDDEAADIRAFVAETGARFPVLWDENKAVAKSFDPPTMPTAFIIDQAGIVRFVHVGYRPGDEAEIERQVRSLVGS